MFYIQANSPAVKHGLANQGTSGKLARQGRRMLEQQEKELHAATIGATTSSRATTSSNVTEQAANLTLTHQAMHWVRPSATSGEQSCGRTGCTSRCIYHEGKGFGTKDAQRIPS
ncbi:hypothetical protein V6N13_051244 [Hibiscus sabdariffa]